MFPNLPIEPSVNTRPAARVCIATYEILGPSKNGGIGTAYHSLATTLAAANHRVTILYLWAGRSGEAEMRYWESQFRELGITFVPLRASSGIHGVPDCMHVAFDAHSWLRKQQFDIIHFPELHGHAYYCVLAKRQGLDFHRTTLCIGTHSPISWIREQNKEGPYSPDELEMDFMERRCVALADVVVSPSQYMLGWMRRNGFVLPAQCYVQQNIAPSQSVAAMNWKKREPFQKTPELVFFGRLEARKGISLFCDALDLLKRENLPPFGVTFLGKNGRIDRQDGAGYIRARAEQWTFPCRILTDYGRDAALQFLAEDAGRIAVIPSFEDNLPNTVMECLAVDIPFLAAKSGGIPELIALSDVERTTFPPDSAQLARRLTLAIRNGVAVAKPAIEPEENRSRWLNWHAALASDPDHHGELSAGRQSAQPLVTVCLNYRGNCELLQHSLDSVRRQTYERLEVLLCDCTAEKEEGQLQRVAQNFDSKNWRILRTGASCNSVPIAEATGEYILFIEGSDYLAQDAISVFVSVANQIRADVLTCFLAHFSGAEEPAEENLLGHCLFLGCAAVSGVFRNYFGQRAVFVKKDTLMRLGGFPVSSPREIADWEFLARAVLMDSRMDVVPVPLAWCPIFDQSGSNVPVVYHRQLQAIIPYAQAMPPALRDLPKAAMTMGLHHNHLLRRFYDSPARTILQRLAIDGKDHSWEQLIPDEGALFLALNRMPRRARKKITSILDAWLDYSQARAALPPVGMQRISHIARQLLRGHYHRYGHGFGSALRDLRKPSQTT